MSAVDWFGFLLCCLTLFVCGILTGQRLERWNK